MQKLYVRPAGRAEKAMLTEFISTVAVQVGEINSWQVRIAQVCCRFQTHSVTTAPLFGSFRCFFSRSVQQFRTKFHHSEAEKEGILCHNAGNHSRTKVCPGSDSTSNPNPWISPEVYRFRSGELLAYHSDDRLNLPVPAVTVSGMLPGTNPSLEYLYQIRLSVVSCKSCTYIAHQTLIRVYYTEICRDWETKCLLAYLFFFQ